MFIRKLFFSCLTNETISPKVISLFFGGKFHKKKKQIFHTHTIRNKTHVAWRQVDETLHSLLWHHVKTWISPVYSRLQTNDEKQTWTCKEPAGTGCDDVRKLQRGSKTSIMDHFHNMMETNSRCLQSTSLPFLICFSILYKRKNRSTSIKWMFKFYLQNPWIQLVPKHYNNNNFTDS